MSETPRNDDEQFRDPTAPSYDANGERGGSEPTEAVPTDSTQQLPPTSGADAPPPPPPGAGAEVPPPPPNPYAAPPAPGAGSQDPYASQSPYAAQPYPTQEQVQSGQAGGYAPPPPGYGPPPPGYGQPSGYGAAPGAYQAPRQLSGNTITLLVVAGLTTLGCGFGIVALIFAIIAATKSDQPAEQAKFTRWGWIAEGVGLALVVVAIVLVVIFGIALSTSSSNGY